MNLSIAPQVPASRSQDRFYKLFQQASQLLEKHQWEEAINLFYTIAKEKPSYKQNGYSVRQLVKQAKHEQSGYAAIEEGNLETALHHFREINDLEQIIEIEDAMYVQRLESNIQEFENKHQFRQAAWLYDQLLRKFPDDPNASRWEIGQSDCWHQELAPTFDKGVEALEKKEWLEAKRIFTEVLCGDPNFLRHNQLAAALLDQAKWEIRLIANAAMENGRLQEALRDYKEIMDTQKIAQVKEFIYLRSKGQKAALAYEQEGRWRKATAVYDWLLTLKLGKSDSQRWKEARQICATNAKLDRLFDAGIEAMEEQRWELASQKFSAIKKVSPKFKKNGQRASKLNWSALMKQHLPQFLT